MNIFTAVKYCCILHGLVIVIDVNVENNEGRNALDIAMTACPVPFKNL